MMVVKLCTIDKYLDDELFFSGVTELMAGRTICLAHPVITVIVAIPHPRVDYYRGVHHWRCQPVNGRDDIGVDNYLLPLRGRDNPKQNYIKYFFF
ncbi:hypothetical protein ACVVIX_005179, partial [Escherichia coli]